MGPALVSRKARPGYQPVLNQVMGQTLAQLELQGLAKPTLPHIEDQQRSGNDSKNAQLIAGIAQNPGATGHHRRADSRY